MDSTPQKPPRGNKTGKETGVLMRVIKTLSASASTDHRDREKSKLEKEFRKSDLQLDSLLAKHQVSLTSVMTTFSHVCGEVTGAKDRVRAVKSNLQKCKMLLQCRREELQRLWLEGVEHKHALEILDQIEKVRSASDQFTKLLNRKQYVQAVETLMTCLNSWNSGLDQIEGLKDVQAELKIKKHKMYETLREELYNEIYYKLNNPAAFDKRQGSGVFAPFQRSSSDRQSSGRNRGAHLKARKIFLDFNNTAANANQLLRPGESPESSAYITTIVDCMVLLNEVPKFVKDLRHHMEEKLMGVVNSASQQVIEYGDTNGINETESSLFQQLIQLIFHQFRWIIRSHALILQHLDKSLGKNHPPVKIHSEEYLWGKVQTVLQSTLKIYFDISDNKSEIAGGITGTTAFRDTSLDINSYFVKRKPQRTKKMPLFKFEYSLHGLNINDYVAKGDVTDRSGGDRHRFLVCKPSPRNIITIYGVVQDLCSEIEQTIDGQNKCELRKFMGNNVNRVFVQQLYKEISDAVESARKNPDCWRDCISLEEAKTLKSPRPLLQSVVQIGTSVQEIISLSKELPSHSDQLIRILDSLLSSYIEACQNAYNGIVQPDSEDKGVISATWIKDQDIQRLLKSLPNWLKLQKAKDKKVNESMDESPEDVRSQNLRESDLLTGIFNGKTVLKHEILTDMKQLNQLAHLQESLEWFGRTVTGVANTFEQNHNLDPQLKEHLVKIHEMVSGFEDLSDVCLLVLHLEVRVHCFHFLLPMAQHGEFSPGVDTQNPDTEVTKLNRDLTHIQAILSVSLQPMKCKYVFEGVGQLICTILIGCTEHIQRINDNGVKKMCRNIFAIQKTLCDITNQPEQAMDHAREFYELFTHSPEELVDAILEKGPQFKELEYMNALKLLFRSKPGNKIHSLQEHLNRLSNILGDVGVVV